MDGRGRVGMQPDSWLGEGESGRGERDGTGSEGGGEGTGGDVWNSAANSTPPLAVSAARCHRTSRPRQINGVTSFHPRPPDTLPRSPATLPPALAPPPPRTPDGWGRAAGAGAAGAPGLPPPPRALRVMQWAECGRGWGRGRGRARQTVGGERRALPLNPVCEKAAGPGMREGRAFHPTPARPIPPLRRAPPDWPSDSLARAYKGPAQEER